MWCLEEMHGPTKLYFKTHAEVLSAFGRLVPNSDGYIPWLVKFIYDKKDK